MLLINKILDVDTCEVLDTEDGTIDSVSRFEVGKFIKNGGFVYNGFVNPDGAVSCKPVDYKNVMIDFKRDGLSLFLKGETLHILFLGKYHKIRGCKINSYIYDVMSRSFLKLMGSFNEGKITSLVFRDDGNIHMKDAYWLNNSSIIQRRYGEACNYDNFKRFITMS